MIEGNTIKRIREAVRTGKLPLEFTPAQVNNVLNIGYAGTFLPKHRIGNPGGTSELFIQISKGLYKLN